MSKCDSSNTDGITCKSDFSILRFFRDLVITTGVMHTDIAFVANNAY